MMYDEIQALLDKGEMLSSSGLYLEGESIIVECISQLEATGIVARRNFSNLIINDSNVPFIKLFLRALHILSQNCRVTTRVAEAISIAEEVHQLSTVLQDQKEFARSHNLLGMAYMELWDFQTAIAYFNRALEMFTVIADKQGIADSLRNLSYVYMDFQEHQKALEYSERALVLFEELGDKAGLSMVNLNLGFIHAHMMNYLEALEYNNNALTLFKELGRASNAAAALTNSGTCHHNLNNNTLAVEYYQLALEQYRQLGHTKGCATVMGGMGDVNRSIGDYSNALIFFEQQLSLNESIDYKYGICRALTNLGDVLIQLADYTRAEKYLKRSYSISLEINEQKEMAGAMILLANMYVGLKDYPSAIIQLNKALELSEKQGYKKETLYSLLNMCDVYQELEEYDRAHECIVKASDVIHEPLRNWERADINSMFGRLFSEPRFTLHNYAEAEDYLVSALALHTEVLDKKGILNDHRNLAMLYESQERWKESHHHLKKFQEVDAEVRSDAARREAENLEIRRVIAEKEQEREQMKRELEHEARMQQEHLTNKSLQLVQQTSMLERFRAKLDDIVRKADSSEKALREVKLSLNELPQEMQNWNSFEDEFRSVHPKFQALLLERYPSLSKAEVKVCCLLRIGLKSHEIATLLFLSERSIEWHRSNIRKKLNGDANGSLVDLLSTIG